MSRLPDWEHRLSATIAEWRVRPFRWDRDCARWGAAVVIAQTGIDPIAEWRGRYRTKREALELLAEKPMPVRLDELFPRVHPAMARRGDIALTQKSCLGCVLGGEALFYFAAGGMTRVPRREWEGVWGVGRDG
ncbi:hypothetical protein V5F89_12495 [Pelagerythrobacter marensis]|uniref:DUF6950 domain-containing protein n=1 Tax=Pelagerythrobacter marensis TaxID=543877 RepID=A0ABZ2D8B8_9SPHN